MSLYIESLQQDYPQYQVTVDPPQNTMSGDSMFDRTPIQGIMLPQSLEFGTTAKIDKDPIASSVFSLGSGFVKGIMNKVAKAIGNELVGNYAKSLAETMEGWASGSGIFEFSVTMVVFKTGVDGCNTCSSFKNLVKRVNQLTGTRSTLRDPWQQPYWVDKVEWWKSGIMSTLEEQYYISNTFTVTIGDWFSCNRLIPSHARVNFSEYYTQDGSPQYATVDLGFRTYRELNVEELTDIIRDGY